VLAALARHVGRYLCRYEPDPVTMRILFRLLACRTAQLGKHLFVCKDCGAKIPVHNSCRDRHCPQCQGKATALWLEARRERLLPTPHFQVVFTLPSELRPIAFDNQALVYALLFRAAASVLQDLAAQRLEARLGILSVLHTWSSELGYHPHLHCLVTAGGLHQDDARWNPSGDDYLFPQPVMGAMFRGRFLEGLIDAFDNGKLQLRGDAPEAAKNFRSMTRALSKRHARWVVHVEPPKGRPVEHVVGYLARYVKRVAIADSRVLAITDTTVTIATRKGPRVLPGPEFVRRFLNHVLLRSFRKVRYYGLYAPGNAKHRHENARELLVLTNDESELRRADDAKSELDEVTHKKARRAPWRCQVCMRGVSVSDGPPVTLLDVRRRS